VRTYKYVKIYKFDWLISSYTCWMMFLLVVLDAADTKAIKALEIESYVSLGGIIFGSLPMFIGLLGFLGTTCKNSCLICIYSGFGILFLVLFISTLVLLKVLVGSFYLYYRHRNR
jgi:hypothetical protein